MLTRTSCSRSVGGTCLQCLFGVVRLAAMLGLPLPLLVSSVSPPLSPRALRSEQILAAAPSDLEAASLREFVAAAQRVLVGQPDGYAVEVLECGSLAAFLRSRASLERDASGGLKATVSFFLEPEWSCAEHMSNAGAPLLQLAATTRAEARSLAPQAASATSTCRRVAVCRVAVLCASRGCNLDGAPGRVISGH